MSQPQQLIIAGGKLYLADTENHRVLWWNNTSAFTTGQGADGVLGQADMTAGDENRGGTVGAATLSYPQDMATDGSGNLWVSDTGNNRVIKYAAPITSGMAATQVFGQPNLSSNSTNCDRATLSAPTGIILNGNDLWVTTRDQHRALRFDTTSASGSQATAVIGQTNYTSCNYDASGANTGLNSPDDVQLDHNSRLWIMDTGNHRALRYPASIPETSAAADLVVGQSAFGVVDSTTNQSGFEYPRAMSFDSANNLWVADTGNNRALKFSYPAANGPAATLVIGQSDFDSYVSSTGPSNLYAPRGVFADADGNVLVSDRYNNRVLVFQSPAANKPAATAALGQPTMYANYSYWVTSETMNTPAYVLEADSRVYVADTYNNRVLWWNSSSSYYNGRTPDGVLGQDNFNSNKSNRDGGLKGKAKSRINADTLYQPQGMAVDAAGNLWVADSSNNRVLKYARPTVNGQSATLVIGQPDFVTKQSATSITGLSNPTDVKLAPSGDLWIADAANNRVLKFSSPAASQPSAVLVIGQSDFTTGSSACSQAAFDNPVAVALSTSGAIWVADMDNNRVLMFPANPATYGQAASLVLGQTGFTSCTSGLGAATLNGPAGLALNSSSELWVADTQSHRLLKYSNPTASGATADALIGQASFTDGSSNRGGTVAANTLNTPAGLTLNSYGNIWLADVFNHRILKYLLHPEGYTISGTVTTGGSPLPGVTMTLSGGAFATTTTGTGGTYSFSAVTSGGSYTVTPSLSGYAFTPASVSTASLAANWTGNDFSAETAYTLSGQILINGQPASDVTVKVEGTSRSRRAAVSTSTVTDASGNYAVTLPPGNYTATPSRAGYYFNPPQFSAALTQNLASNFTSAYSGDKAAFAEAGTNGYMEPGKGDAKLRLNPTQSGHVSAKIYTLRRARLVRSLEADVTAGSPSTILWDGRNTDGELVGSGIYVMVLNGAGYDNEKVKIGVLR